MSSDKSSTASDKSSTSSDISSTNSTNIFEAAKQNSQELEAKLLGPDYKYFKYVNTPAEMDMSSKGSMSTISKNIAGLIGYVKVLTSGGGRASQISGPLGNKFFLETGAKCTDKKSKESVIRSVYVNNVPDGSIPFISQGLDGVNLSEFKGLIPGTLSNLAQINPMQIFGAFMTGNSPECQAITMETIDVDNVKGTKTAFLTTNDIGAMSPCWFPNKTNPINNNKCRETFTTMREDKFEREGITMSGADFISDPEFMGDAKEYENYVNNYHKKYEGPNVVGPKTDFSKMPNDKMVRLYYSSLGLLMLYIFYRMFQKKKL